MLNHEKVLITSDNPVSLIAPENVFMSENIHIEINEYAKIGNVSKSSYGTHTVDLAFDVYSPHKIIVYVIYIIANSNI